MPLIRVIDGGISGGGEAGPYDRKGSMRITGETAGNGVERVL
jgi:hypothetical protein